MATVSKHLPQIDETRAIGAQDSRLPGIYCDRKSGNVARILKGSGYHLVAHESKAEMLWVRKGFKPRVHKLLPYQLLNHIPNETAMINKGHLTQNLKRFEQEPLSGTKDSLRMGDFYPESYCLFDAADREIFFQQLPETDLPDNLWIYKPGNRKSVV